MQGSIVTRTIGFELGSIEDAEQAFSGDINCEDFVYARRCNPTVRVCEERMAELEGAKWSILTASGMAAIDIAVSIFQGEGADRPWLFPDDAYSGTLNYASTVLNAHRGIEVVFAKPADPDMRTEAFVETILETRPSVVFFEPISNPLISIVDGPEIVRAAKSVGAIVIVDNTFATPYLCKPLEWGADLVVHSATKYLCGHNDTLAGVISGNDAALQNKLLEYRNLVGSVLAPDEAARLHSYSRTFDVRMGRHNNAAMAVADVLAKHPAVSEVYFPGLTAGRQKKIARSLFGNKGFGAIITFRIASGLEGCRKFVKELNSRLPHIGTLGDVETSILHIESGFPGGYPDDAFRLSIGIEDPDWIIGVLEPALNAVDNDKKE